ncbi:hypothetical protein B0H13DRAFT_2353148 [Mycena leptocephala]|nr:hypothetical protein B0H13DRAFT_2353148 [Mycena leptocephala]
MVQQLYGANAMKPNHHWAVHVPEQVLDYGPLYGIWAFLTERLNKVLKNLNSNNWSGGLLEVSMMREFHRMAQLEGMLNRILGETPGHDLLTELQMENQFIRLLFETGENREALGTVQDAATHERTLSRVSLGSIAEKSVRIEDDAMRLGLEMLGSVVDTYDYALLDGRRVTSTTRSRRGAGSSLIQIYFKGEIYAGEIQHLFRHKQQGIPESNQTLMAFVVWMVPSTDTPLDNDSFIWYEFPELGVETWVYKQYAMPNDPDFPPQVLPMADIRCQVAQGKIRYTKPPLWITTTMDRFPTSLAAYGAGNATGNDE